jgi:hypothetical protein
MVQGHIHDGEYFVDFDIVSESTGRAIFGAWIIICATTIGIWARSIHRSRLKRRLHSSGQDNGAVSLWAISPATDALEFLELRNVFWGCLSKREFSFVLASFACVAAIVLSAGSTAISNRAVVSNIVDRVALVPGHLAENDWDSFPVATPNVTSRLHALENANAPIEELFDFIPDDASDWKYMAKEWNNSWHGRCTYSTYPAVDLVVVPTDSSMFQDEIPSLGQCLPSWTSESSTIQERQQSGCSSDNHMNFTYAWHDDLITYAFSTKSDASPFRISFVNLLLHHIGEDSSGRYVQAGLKSDVHVADCIFENTSLATEHQARAGGYLFSALLNVASVSFLSTWSCICP